MATGIEELLPKEYGFVVIDVVIYFLLNLWMIIQVGNARNKYKVSYPTLYASESENKEAKLFNCIQRGHQHSLELMPPFFVVLILGGLQHPIIASSLGLIYSITRYFYFKGYSTGVPQNRLPFGTCGVIALIGLMFCTASLGIHLILPYE